jgi:hypothetical protein
MKTAAGKTAGRCRKEGLAMALLRDCRIPGQDWLREAGERNGSSRGPARLRGINGEQAQIADAGAWEPTVQAIVRLQDLENDWDGLGAQAPTRELLASAIGLAYTLMQKGMDPPSRVVPGLDGTVAFEWQTPDGTYCEVEIERPFHAAVMLIEPGQPAKHWTLPTE